LVAGFFLNLAKITLLKKIWFFFLVSLLSVGVNVLLAQAPKKGNVAPKKVVSAPGKPVQQTAPKKIIIENSDHFDVNQVEIPDAALLTGNVRINHDGVIMTCNKAYFFQKENYIKAFGNVHMVQGDTLFMDSKYAEYNGNLKQAFATGNVVMRSPDMTLATDTINFDRNKQEAWYDTYGTITNKDNVLKSKSGRYYVSQKKFQFLTAVVLTNPKYVLKSNHLDYYNNSGHSYLFGPSTITSEQIFIYTEKGFYDSKKNVGHFLRRSYIKYKDRLIEGDSLYYDRKIEFASATNNVKVTDSINKGIIKGHYAEVYKQKDSMFVTKRAVAINLVDKDSVYIHGKVLMITGKPEARIIRAFNNARIFKTDLSGKCDSIHSSQKTNITQLIGKPILWNFKNQMTGDVMHLIGNDQTQKLDSLKVLGSAFIISKDTIGTGYNQVKGLNLYGKFRDNKLYEADIVKNTEVIYYMRNDKNELIGINKNVSSKINMTLDGNTIDTMTFFTNVDGDIYPEKDLPENARKLRGFIWRGDEIMKTKDDIFPPEENELNDKIIEESKAEMAKENVPMEIRKETLDYDKNNPQPKPKAETEKPTP
jgi:lipopolysaccharide export system protein LptA